MALTADQIAAVSRLLDQALLLDQDDRQRWLEDLSLEDEALLPALRQALLFDEGTFNAGLLGTLPRVWADDKAPTLLVSGLKAGQHIGPYQLVRELGAGGMAVVWLAQRADGAFRREVALKLPLLSRLRRDLAERFARERQILAQLEHPNIARLYDAGISADGLPYLALEYVEGEPLTTWCDEYRCSVRERLRLFLQVLEAVHYAHSCQIIHRDLKPTNILVTQSGQVRLLDFGVAKLLAEGDDADADQADLTRVYGRALTPDYASPEQLGNGVVGAASDTYGLGVVLYELLVGSRPYRIKGGSAELPLELAIQAAQVRKPSTQVEPAAALARASTHKELIGDLRGDLDAIVLKALAKQPEDRYPTAAAFSDDLQRFLSGAPVHARPAALPYRTGKWLKRRPMVAGAIALSLVAAVALIGLGRYAWLEQVRAQSTEAQALVDTVGPASKSIAVLPFVDLSEGHDQEYFSDGLSDELIDLLARTGDLRVIARTSSFQFKGRNEDVRQIARKLGVESVLEGSVRKVGSAIRVTVQLIKGSDGSHLWSRAYDRDLTDVFTVQDEICSTVASALHVALSDPPPNRASERNIEAYNAFLQGWYFYQRATEDDLRRSVAAYREALRLDPQYARVWAELARAYIRQGSWQWDTIQSAYSKAREAAERALAIDPNQPIAHRMLGYVYWDYDLNREAGQAEFKKSRELDPSDADALSALTIVALAYGRIDEAIELKGRNAQADPLDALMLDDLGSLYLDAGHPAEAERAVRKALALEPSYTGGHCNLGLVLLERGQPELALQQMQQEGDQAARAGCLPFAYWAVGRHRDADAALRVLTEKYADLNAYGIAQVYAFEGRTDKAFEWLGRAFRQRELGLTMIKADHFLRGLRSDSRFGELLTQMRLPAQPTLAAE